MNEYKLLSSEKGSDSKATATASCGTVVSVPTAASTPEIKRVA